MAADMTLYSSTSYVEAMQMSVLDLERFFTGKAFEAFRKNKEAEYKMLGAMIKRVDGVIKALGYLIKKS